jgi:hypothetical protein
MEQRHKPTTPVRAETITSYLRVHSYEELPDWAREKLFKFVICWGCEEPMTTDLFGVRPTIEREPHWCDYCDAKLDGVKKANIIFKMFLASHEIQLARIEKLEALVREYAGLEPGQPLALEAKANFESLKTKT